MHKTSAWPLALIYGALIVFASLFPFEGWREQGISPWVFFTARIPPPYWTWFDVNLNVDIQALVWTGIGGYTVARNSSGTLDLFGGVRYLGLETSTDLSFSGPDGVLGRSGGASDKINVWDGIVGVRGAVNLGDSGDWFLPYYLDIGTGNYSNWTWQGWAGVGYRFDWGDLVLVYRNLSYSTTGDESLEDMRMAGPALGATFRW